MFIRLGVGAEGAVFGGLVFAHTGTWVAERWRRAPPGAPLAAFDAVLLVGEGTIATAMPEAGWFWSVVLGCFVMATAQDTADRLIAHRAEAGCGRTGRRRA
jgi:hypothetical protein